MGCGGLGDAAPASAARGGPGSQLDLGRFHHCLSLICLTHPHINADPYFETLIPEFPSGKVSLAPWNVTMLEL